MDFLIPVTSTLLLALAILLLIVSLFAAPWQVLLMILIVGLVLTQRMMADLRRSASSAQGSPHQSPKQTSTVATAAGSPSENLLHYRGASYSAGPSATAGAEPPPVPLVGKYRGCTWQAAQPSEPQQTK